MHHRVQILGPEYLFERWQRELVHIYETVEILHFIFASDL